MNDLRERTKSFALRCMKLSASLPKDRASDILAKQLIRSATSVGANYRSALRGRSKAEFVAKVGICLEEVDESEFWLDLISSAGLMKSHLVEPLQREANELTAIFVTSIKSSKK